MVAFNAISTYLPIVPADSTLADAAYPYWAKKDRKLKKRHPVLMAELRDLHADVICLQVRLPETLGPQHQAIRNPLPSSATHGKPKPSERGLLPSTARLSCYPSAWLLTSH